MSQLVHLESDRLVVREWRAEEVEGMHRWFGNPEVRRFLSFGADSKAESERHLLDTVLPAQHQDPRREYYLALELKATGRTIGDVGFEWKGPGLAEIGYFLEPHAWGEGYATEAVKLLLSHLFRLGAEAVIASCDENNGASENVMVRCGLRRQPAEEPGRLLYKIERAEFSE